MIDNIRLRKQNISIENIYLKKFLLIDSESQKYVSSQLRTEIEKNFLTCEQLIFDEQKIEDKEDEELLYLDEEVSNLQELNGNNKRNEIDNINEININNLYFRTYVNGVMLTYYPVSRRFYISGKLKRLDNSLDETILLSKVINFDDYMKDSNDIENFFIEANKTISQYAKGIDIRSMTVTRIDYCININTCNVDIYCEFFNSFFQNKTYAKKYLNFVREENKKIREYNKNKPKEKQKKLIEPIGSYYVKAKKQYKNNERNTYVINFYNKHDEILKKESKLKKDNDLSKNTFRLEVQVYHQILRNWKQKTLKSLFNYELAHSIIRKKIIDFVGEWDYLNYDKVKEKLIQENKYSNREVNQKGFERFCREISRNKTPPNDMTDAAINKYKNILKKCGIFPYRFLDNKYGIEILENPVKLLDEKARINNSYKLIYKNDGV